MGPLGLLGVSPESCTDEQIVVSLERQLDRVSQHAEGDTPEADEVRLALHAAAAQLLDKNVRRHVLARLGVSMPEGSASDAGASAPSATSLEQDAILTLAMYGGWNQRSIQRLAAIAHARGLSSAAMAQSLQHLAAKRRRPASARRAGAAGQAGARPHSPASSDPAGPPEGGATSESELQDWHDAQARRYIRNFVLGAGGALVVLIGLTVYLVMLLVDAGSGTRPPAPATGQTAPNAPPPGTTGAPTFAPPSGLPASVATDPDPEATPATGKAAATGNAREDGYVDPLLVVRTLRDAASQARSAPDESLPKFLGALQSLMSRWCRFDPQQRLAADSAVVDYLYAIAGAPSAAESAIAPIIQGVRQLPDSQTRDATIGPGDIWPSVWAAGFLTRASRERELPANVSNAIEAALSAAIGADRPRLDAKFESGAIPALRRIPAALLRWHTASARTKEAPLTSGAPLAPWIEAVTAIAGADANLRERLLAEGLEQVLLSAPEPREDKFVFEAIGELGTEIKWRKGGPARARLLAWFKDERVSIADLQTLTGVIATRSAAEGVDPMMVLSSGASGSDRERLRGQYVKAWGETGVGPAGETTTKWIEAARAEIARSESLDGEIAWLECAARLAELNEAATKLWRGEVEVVAGMVENAGVAADTARAGTIGTVTGAPRPPQPAFVQSEGDGRWLAAYLSAGRSIPERLQRLRELEESADPIGQADAELLVELACLETPSEVRSAAQRVVLKYSHLPVIVNGLLKTLPRAPKYSTVSRMIENVVHEPLPRATDPAWEYEARRALVQRLLELMAQNGDQAAVNDLASLVFESYAARAGLEPPSDDAALDAQSGANASAALWRQWRRSAEAVSPNPMAPVSLEAIDRRYAGRVSLASGPIQRFAADQVSIAELMAYVVSAEPGNGARDTGQVVQDLTSARREATHVFEQLMIVERAMLRLWLVRFEVSP